MKRVIGTVLSIVVCLLIFTLSASAEDASVYVIEQSEEGEYRFLKNGIVSSEADSLDRLLDGVSELDLPIYLKDVATDEAVTLNGGDYILSGSLAAPRVTVEEGASLTLEECSIVLDEGVLLQGGRLIFNSGSVESSATAVSLDFSALSTLEMNGGRLLSASGAPTLAVMNGNAYLKGGSIENSAGTAIEAYTGLRLGNATVTGHDYEVIAHAPVFASADISPSTRFRIKYTSLFNEGTSTDVILGATADRLECFSLVDRDGKEYSLTALDGNLAVYLPYTVKYVHGGEVVEVVERLRGEVLSSPTFSAPFGYLLLGWYTDVHKRVPFDFASKIEGDMTLYAKCELEKPQYSINDIDVTYSGRESVLRFSSLTHKLEGAYSYEWYNERGELVSTMDSLSVTTVEQSGEYKCKLTFTHGTDSITFETLPVCVTVRPMTVLTPTVQTAMYDGTEQTPLITGVGFTYTDASFVNAGVYQIELELTDPINTRWKDTDGKFLTVSFEIKKANNYFTDELRINDTYYGADILAAANSRYGIPSVIYSISPDGPFTDVPPDTVGVYYARAVVEATSNYEYLEGEVVSFNILEDHVTCFAVSSHPIKSVYRSFEQFDPEGLSFSVVYASGKSEVIAADAVSFSYLSGDSFRISHGAIVAAFAGHSCLLPVTVIPAEYTLTVTLADAVITYDGTYHTLTPSGELPVGLDGIALEYAIKGGGTSVGAYTVTLEFYTDSVEYNAPSSVTATLEIVPRTASVIWGDAGFVYDGKPKCPTAYFVDINGARIPLTVQGAASLAGDGYVATALSSDINYLLEEDTLEYSIAKADIDLSGLLWNADRFVYSGEQSTVTLSGLPDGVSVVGYINPSATDVGIYVATAVLSYDTRNYNSVENPTHTFVIEPAEYNTSGFSFVGGEYVYDGLLHFPELVGEMPVGLDGLPLSYSFSSGVMNALDSTSVTVVFSTESKNYIVPDPINVTVTVMPKGIYVDWRNTELVYNGTAQAPVPSSTECIVYTSDIFTDAGVYTATAVTDNTNFVILNPTAEYRISPAENEWKNYPTVGDVFFGTPPTPSAVAFFGTVVFEYYSDTDLTEPVSLPLSTGKYYLVARADAGQNYKPLASAPIPFNVVPILPASLRADGRTDYVAFEKIGSGDITITLVNNDGSTRPLTLGDVFIEYASEASFHAGDEWVTLRYGELSLIYSVSVGRAEYDMSGVIWNNIEVSYDGEPQYPTLSGLPSGVEVSQYYGVGVTDAGEYRISAAFSYDSQNYNEPKIPVATLRILKKGITPEYNSVIYSGAPQSPTAQSPLYVPETVEYTDAGSYSVKCTLLDDKNYYLVTDCAEFVISPAIISVLVADADGYWFDEPTEFDLTFLEGFGTSREELMIEFYIEGDRILVRSGNPNYFLDVTAGRLVKHNRFSPRVTRALFICFLLFIILASGIIIVVIRRADFVDMYYRMFRRSTVVATTGGAEYTGTEYMSIDVERADELITDGIARTLIRKEDEVIHTDGTRRYVVNVDTLSESFIPGERVDINVLKARGIIPADAGYVKILGRGTINKPLRVYANAFSLSAVKMLALTGGEVYRVKNK